MPDDRVKSCPFCGTQPEVDIRAYYWPPTCYVTATICCLKCIPVSDNPVTRKGHSVRQHVFWTDEEILKHVPGGLSLYNKEGRFDRTTARAAKAAAREVVLDLWQRREPAKAAGGE